MEEAFTEATTAKKRKSQAREKVNLTDRLLKFLKGGEQPYEVMDIQVRGFGIRVMPSGVKTFILRRRYPGSKQPARRALGSFGETGLAEAREKAREWNALAKKGIDPSAEEERQRKAALEAERQQKSNTFGSAFEAYLQRKASKLKSFRTIDRELRRECAAWMNKPLSSISPLDVKQLVRGIADSGRETQAHAILSLLRAFLNWISTFKFRPAQSSSPLS
jgi:hypothetical protein